MKKNLFTWAILSIGITVATAPTLASLMSVVMGQATLFNLSLFGHGHGGYLSSLSIYYSSLPSSLDNIEAFIIALVFVAVIIAGTLAYLWAKNPKRIAQDGILGDSKIIDSTAERRRRNDTWNGIGVPPSAGLVYGFERGRYYYDGNTPHVFTAGRTGSGKSRYMALETLHLSLAAGYNLIVSDIKNEMLELTGDKASELGKVIVFDLENPTFGNRYSPLQIIVSYAESGDMQRVREAADQLANDLVRADEKNPFFSNAARGLLSACCIAVATEDIPEVEKNMGSVCDLIDLGTTGTDKDPATPLKDYLRSLGSAHPAFSPASEFLSDGGTTAGKNVLSTVKVALRPFTAPGIRWMTSRSDFSIEELISTRTTIYLHVLGKDNPYNTLFTCFFNQYWRTARHIGDANGGKLPYRTAILGDEWANLPKVDALPEIVTLGRSYGLSWWGFCQNVSQMNKYNSPGDNNAGREELLGNVGIKVALSLGDETDRKWFTALCGKRTVRVQNQSYQKGGDRGSYSESMNEHVDDIVHEWDWTHRSPDKDGAIVIKAKENNADGRNGVFRMPLVDATKTPAKSYFGLGTPHEEQQKRQRYQAHLRDKGASENLNVRTWHPDFCACASASTKTARIEVDEWGAWDEGVER